MHELHICTTDCAPVIRAVIAKDSTVNLLNLLPVVRIEIPTMSG